MKRKITTIFLMLLVTFASAQTDMHQWGLGLGAGFYRNNDAEAFGFMPQLTINKYVSPSFDVRMLTEIGLFNENDVQNLDLVNLGVNLKYKFNNGYILQEHSLFQPYVYGGPSYLFDNKDEGLDLHLGVGTRIALSPKLKFFVEGGYIDGLKLENDDNNWDYKDSHLKATAGVIFNFSKAKDADGDGVPDNKDQCPDTPIGVEVDSHGCPVDSDGDGVPDYIDDCPNEPGLIAFKGCPDTDGDGVPDKKDECPDVFGLEEFDGCPDSDNDGVPDRKDKCPDTPELWKVDEDGCPLDSDGDGVLNEEDDCPDQAGTKENNGCPEVTPEAIENFKPVLFDTDKSELRTFEIEQLETLIKALKEHPEYSFRIYGYADERASKAYNMELSIDRAQAVEDYFKQNGISKERILEIKGFGETRPAVPNTSPENMQKNRRVELEFVKR